jgi:hypothetical protein
MENGGWKIEITAEAPEYAEVLCSIPALPLSPWLSTLDLRHAESSPKFFH